MIAERIARLRDVQLHGRIQRGANVQHESENGDIILLLIILPNVDCTKCNSPPINGQSRPGLPITVAVRC